jgi:hypothetical protein
VPPPEGVTDPQDAVAGQERPVDVVRHRGDVEDVVAVLDRESFVAGVTDAQESHGRLPVNG